MIVLFSSLLVIQVKKYGCHRDLVLFKKVKTWVLIFAITQLILFLESQLITPYAMNWVLYSLMWASINIFR